MQRKLRNLHSAAAVSLVTIEEELTSSHTKI